MCHAETQTVSRLHKVVCAWLGGVLGKQPLLGKCSAHTDSFSLEPHPLVPKKL